MPHAVSVHLRTRLSGPSLTAPSDCSCFWAAGEAAWARGVPDAAQAHRQEVDQAGDHGMPNHIAEVEADRIQVIAPVAAVVHPLHLLPSNRCNMAALKTSAHVTNVRHDGNSPQWHQELGFALPTLPDPSQTVPSTALVQALLDLPTVQMPDYAC